MADRTLDGGAEVTLAGDPSLSTGGSSTQYLPAGSLVGRYVILGMLGIGGMGEVYAAFDPELDRKIALKVLHAVPGKDQTLGAARLVREAQALARLSHPNVVAVHDVGTFEGRVFVGMEFVDGETLDGWLKSAPRPQSEILRVMVDAGRGLAAAHAAGLIHRDFKPHNVMVRADGRVLVMDFGVARPNDAPELDGDAEASEVLDEDLSTMELTAAGELVGTPAYMAPEQHRSGEVDARTDQFSYCVTLYEALYGERPFKGESLAAVAFRVSQGEVREAPSGSRVSSRLRRVVLKGLSVKPQNRYASMEELLEAVARAGRGRGRLALGGLGVALIAGALAAGPVMERRQLAACKRHGAQIQQVWNEEAREGVRSGLEAAGIFDPAKTDERVARWLDEYASRWAEIANEACIAAEVRGDRSPSIVAASEDCLTQHQDALEVLIEDLSQADRDLARYAAEAASSLPSLSACADEKRLLARPPLPEDSTSHEQVRAERRALTRAKTLLLAGRHVQAQDAAAEIEARTTTLGYAPLTASVLLTKGLILSQAGEFEESVAVHQEAFAVALGIGADEAAASAAERLVFLYGVKLAKFEESEHWERLARELLHRIDTEDGVTASAVDHAAGMASLLRGDYDDAQANFESALGKAEGALGPDHPTVANSLNLMGILALVQGDYPTALAYHDRALEIREASFDPGHPKIGQSHANRGNVFYQMEDYAQALESYRAGLEAVETTYGPDHPDAALALNNMGNALDEMGDEEGALEAYARALAIREQTYGPDHPEVSQTLLNIAIVERKQGKLELARQKFERSLEIKLKTLKPEEHGVVLNRIELGRALRELGELEKAREQLEEAVRVFESREGDPRNLAFARIQYAKVLQAIDPGDPQARSLAEQALAALSADAGADLREEAQEFLASLED